ncbi:MAG: site-specific DNA-methyltransferase, partial [Rhodobacteraceae bacterium]|nr:site-specific DNA-methyltransferase [Paracoccaceae bacterium]
MDRLWRHYARILAPRGAIALMCHGAFTADVILSKQDWFKYKVVWVKSKATNFLNARKQPLRKHEDICVFYRAQPTYVPQMSEGEAYDKGVRKNQLTGSYGDFRPSRITSSGARYPTDVVYFKTAEAEGPVWHPTQKPVELGRYLVRTYTTEKQIVLDHCFGSASFLVAAAMENRRSIGIEKNCDLTAFKKVPVNMFDVAKERLAGVASVHCPATNGDLTETVNAFI